jgi:uncharacterized protein
MVSQTTTDVTNIAWRRLDVPGHDAATLSPRGDGWDLEGAAVLVRAGVVCHLNYVVKLDGGWNTRSADVKGWVGTRRIDLRIEVGRDGQWTLNDQLVDAVRGCVDIDFAFTPSTNLLPIRRLALPVGGSQGLVAAWLRFPDFDLQPLDQVYLRSGELSYEYQSRGGSFRASLSVSPEGFVVDYPGLWTQETAVNS